MTCKEALWAMIRDPHASYRVEIGVKEILNRMQKDTVEDFFHTANELRYEMPNYLIQTGVDVVLDSIVRSVLVEVGREKLLKSWLAAGELVK